jgi:hypothetical protein
MTAIAPGSIDASNTIMGSLVVVGTLHEEQGVTGMEDSDAYETEPVTATKDVHLNGPNTSSTTSRTPPVDNGRRKFEFPPCVSPSPTELAPIETFVENAISSQHSDVTVGEGSSEPTSTSDGHKGYRAIADALRRPEDPVMLHRILIALRTAGKGSSLYKVACFSQNHAQLTHLIFKFNPFDIPNTLQAASEEVTRPYRDYSMADAYMHLVVAMISANSVHVVPAMTAIWKRLNINRSEGPEEMYVVLRTHVTEIHCRFGNRTLTRGCIGLFLLFFSFYQDHPNTCPFHKNHASRSPSEA